MLKIKYKLVFCKSKVAVFSFTANAQRADFALHFCPSCACFILLYGNRDNWDKTLLSLLLKTIIKHGSHLKCDVVRIQVRREPVFTALASFSYFQWKWYSVALSQQPGKVQAKICPLLLTVQHGARSLTIRPTISISQKSTAKRYELNKDT